jgi:hypothetical protein
MEEHCVASQMSSMRLASLRIDVLSTINGGQMPKCGADKPANSNTVTPIMGCVLLCSESHNVSNVFEEVWVNEVHTRLVLILLSTRGITFQCHKAALLVLAAVRRN